MRAGEKSDRSSARLYALYRAAYGHADAGDASCVGGILMPALLTEGDMGIYTTLRGALAEDNPTQLLYAAVLLLILNSLRSAPAYRAKVLMESWKTERHQVGGFSFKMQLRFSAAGRISARIRNGGIRMVKFPAPVVLLLVHERAQSLSRQRIQQNAAVFALYAVHTKHGRHAGFDRLGLWPGRNFHRHQAGGRHTGVRTDSAGLLSDDQPDLCHHHADDCAADPR